MTPVELLAELRSRGIEIEVVGEAIRYRPAGALPPELRDVLREQKPAVLALLAAAVEDEQRPPFSLRRERIAQAVEIWLRRGCPRSIPIWPE